MSKPLKITSKSIPSLPSVDIQAKLAEYAHDARGAYSENTQRAIQSDTHQFMEWCADTKRIPLPASSETLCAYIDTMSRRYAPTTVRRRISSISHLHRAAQAPDPTKIEKVRLAVKRMQRKYGKRPKQAKGLTEADIAAILATTPHNTRGVRDIALILTARDLLLRRSELVDLNVDDICFSEDGTATVLIRRSKTDQDGEGTVLWLSQRTTSSIHDWLALSDITEGPLFRSLRKSGRTEGRLSSNSVSAIFKNMAARAGINAAEISAHSSRIGMAQDLASSGAELPELMTAVSVVKIIGPFGRLI